MALEFLILLCELTQSYYWCLWSALVLQWFAKKLLELFDEVWTECIYWRWIAAELILQWLMYGRPNSSSTWKLVSGRIRQFQLLFRKFFCDLVGIVCVISRKVEWFLLGPGSGVAISVKTFSALSGSSVNFLRLATLFESLLLMFVFMLSSLASLVSD